MSTIKSVYLQHLNGTTPNATMDTNGNFTVGGTVSGASSNMFRNRIINGDMRIDQRNAGASVTPTVDPTYSVDRFYVGFSQASKMTAQQQTSVVPTGFSHALKISVASAVTPSGGDFFIIGQAIEASNVSDFNYGTANTKTSTLSFQVNSSVAGTYSGVLKNSAQNRSYPFQYTISQANTWTSISITISGDTTGTWITSGNGLGIAVQFCLGVGTTYAGAVNTWAATNYVGSTGTTQWISNAGATFYITGVQLEIGTAATPFEVRSYGHELALCQRYHQGGSTTAASVKNSGYRALFYAPVSVVNGSQIRLNLPMKATMRATPTITYEDNNGNLGKCYFNGVNQTIADYNVTAETCLVVATASGSSGIVDLWVNYALSAEL